jgi:hypothetical protein
MNQAIFDPNPEIEIQHSQRSLHPWTLRKIIDEPSGAPQILHKTPEYKHHRELQEFYFGIWV